MINQPGRYLDNFEAWMYKVNFSSESVSVSAQYEVFSAGTEGHKLKSCLDQLLNINQFSSIQLCISIE